jgi:hypothetical protein
MSEALQIAAGLAVLTWYLSALIVGGRLLRLGLRGDNGPARWIGIYLFVAMGLGSILISIPMARGALEGIPMTALDRALVAGGLTATAIGNVAILTFTRRVFRRESALALGFALAVGAMLVGGAIGHGVTTGFDWSLTGAFAVLYLSGTVLSNGWIALESLHYYGLMRRRLRLGLAEPLDANRFLLWGTAAGAAAVMLLWTTIELQFRTLMTLERVESIRAYSLPTMAVLGLVCAGCYLFAFFPAAWYVRRFAAAPSSR